jgi:hypothetical protein
MKAMDYVITGHGPGRTITPRTERAKGRTPEPITFRDVASALEFVNAAAVKGYRFSGHELVDPKKKLVSYGYYLRHPSGHFVLSGQDWGPSDPVFEPGDMMPGGPKNGKEAFILRVISGDTAKKNGVDVLILLEERDVEGATGRPVPAPEAAEPALNAVASQPPPSQAPPTIQIDWAAQNVRIVAIWNKVIFRSRTETFHEFLIEVPVKGTFGEDWYKQQVAKPEDERHIVERWLRAFREESQRNRPADHKPGQVYAGPATGATTELIALAHDLYMLQKVNRLPDRLVDRLRNYNEFQGARYEVAIAAAFVKCGFEIEWLEGRAGRHPEFIARNGRTRDEVAVETKSRRRPGVLHHRGVLPPEEELRADVDRLYREALRQDLGDRPFAIFLDVNLPPSTAPGVVAHWQREIADRWQNTQQQVALLGFTNFAWHYIGDQCALPTGPEFILAVPASTARPLRSEETIRSLQAVLRTYGVCPNEY